MDRELAKEWSTRPNHRGAPFIEDGIIDLQAWDAAPRRVLFLLKEAYDTSAGQDGFDLCELVRDKWKGPRGTTWWRIGHWAHLLHSITAEATPPFPSDRSAGKSAVLASAIVNIRKSGGQKRSDADEIREYARMDADLLRRQIQDINPDLIVAGSVWDAVCKMWDPKSVSNRFHQLPVGPIIEFWHPAAQIHNKLLYFALAGIVHAAETARTGALPSRRAVEGPLTGGG